MNLAHLSNDELLAGIQGLTGQARIVLARLLAYLGEVEERRLDLQSACSSLFEFCLRRLGMSEDEACRRVAAARIVRRFPLALSMIERGEIHLTGLLMLREHLTPERGEELLRAAAGKSKGELQHLLAERFPRPDAPSRIQTLTPPAASTQATGQRVNAASSPSPIEAPSHPCLSRIEPLAPARYRVEFTASDELKDKLGRVADLMRHSNPSGELSVIVERALDLLLAKLEKERLAKATRAREEPALRSQRSGYVPRSVRREVFERDRERCTFFDESGRRCESRTWLELDHRVARALGGADDASNLRVRCRAHNRLSAEQLFGREHMDRAAAHRPAENAGSAAVTSESQPAADASCVRAEEAGAANHPRRRGDDEVVFRALCGLGFQAREARRAVGIVGQRRAGTPPVAIEISLREAFAVLAR